MRRSGTAMLIVFALLVHVESAHGDVVHLYDPLGRLVKVIDATGQAAVYVYDPVGNILKISRQTGVPQDQTSLASVDPLTAPQGGAATLTFTGINLAGAFLPTLPSGFTITGYETDVSGNLDVVRVTIAVDPEQTLGSQSLTLVSSLGAVQLPFSLSIVQPGPRIDRVIPPLVTPGALIQIEGAAFDPAGSTANQVTINGVPLTVVKAQADTLIALVPLGVTSGPVSVTTSQGTGVAPSPLTVVAVTHPTQSTVTATLTSPFRGPTKIALSPDGSRAWILNTGRNVFGNVVSSTAGSVIVVDTASATVAGVLPIAGPTAVAVTPDGTHALVTRTAIPTAVVVLNAATLATVTTITMSAGPRDVVISPDGAFAYVAVDPNMVSVINLGTLTHVGTVTLASAPQSLVLADGGTLYALGGARVTVIDTAARTILRTFALSLNVSTFGLDHGTQRLYIGGTTPTLGAAVAQVVSLETGAVLQTVNGFAKAHLSPDGARLYLIDTTGTLAVRDTATFTELGTLALGSPIPSVPQSSAISSDGATLWLASANDGSVRRVDTQALAQTATVPVGVTPGALALVPGRADLYVLNGSSSTVSVLDTGTAVVRVTALDTFGLVQPLGAVVPRDGSAVYVANNLSAITNTAGTTTAYAPATGAGLATLSFGDSRTGLDVIPAYSRSELHIGSTTPAGVWVLDLATRAPKHLLPMTKAPRSLGLSLDERRLYAVSDPATGSGTQLTAFDLTTGAQLYTRQVDTILPSDNVAVTLDGTRVYVLMSSNGLVRVHDAPTGNPVTTIATNVGAVSMTWNRTGSRLYIVNFDRVSVIDPATNTVAATITLPSGTGAARNLVVSLDGTKAWVSKGSVNVINTATNTIIRSVSPGGIARSVALSPDGQRLLATTDATNKAALIETTADTVVVTLTVGISSNAFTAASVNVAFSITGAKAWVVNTFDDSVSVIE